MLNRTRFRPKWWQARLTADEEEVIAVLAKGKDYIWYGVTDIQARCPLASPRILSAISGLKSKNLVIGKNLVPKDSGLFFTSDYYHQFGYWERVGAQGDLAPDVWGEEIADECFLSRKRSR